MKIYFTYLLFFLLFLSCSNWRTGKESVGELKARTLKGDEVAFEQLFDVYTYEDNNNDTLLKYSLIMVEKYSNARASFYLYELYSTSAECEGHNLNCLNEETKDKSIKYFRKAIELGDKTASQVLINYYGKGKYYPIEELYKDKALIKRAKNNLIRKRQSVP
jgi:hypothetical protein